MNKRNKLMQIVLTTLLTLTLLITTINPISRAATAPTKLKVHYIDVGQADSILIQEGSTNILIDAGTMRMRKLLLII